MSEKGSEILRELIRIVVRHLGILEKNDATCCGVSLAQCHAIVEIGRNEIVSLGDLANTLGLDKSTMSRTTNNLVESELVNRDLDQENRRYVNIQLTEKGQTVFKTIEESMSEYYEGIFNMIPEEKRVQVLESLIILKEAVEKNKCC